MRLPFRSVSKPFAFLAAISFFLSAASASGAGYNPQTNPIILEALDFRNMDILDVLKLISQKSGLNIVATKNVAGRVNIYLKDIEVLEALEIIVESQGWAYVQDEKTLRIMTEEEYRERFGHPFGQEMKTHVRRLKHARALDVRAGMEQLLGSSGKVIADEISNVIVIVDTPENIYRIDEVIDEMDSPLLTRIFNLNYAKAEDMVNQLTEVTSPARGMVRHDERSNVLIVQDTPLKIQEIQKMIQAFDRRHKEVYIEAKIIQIALTEDHQLGIDWQGIVQDAHNMRFEANFDVFTETQKGATFNIGTLEDDNYTALVQALKNYGKTNILSSPSITTVNNKEAKFLVGSTEPYVTSTTTTPSSGPTTTAETVNFIEVGVKLFVTPTIHNDGFITMKIKPEVSSVTRSVETGNNNEIPVVETSEAETTVMVKDNTTIIIGGLIQDESSDDSKGIPILKKMPVVGKLFGSDSFSSRKTEIVIFLTPKIIFGEENMNERPDFAGLPGTATFPGETGEPLIPGGRRDLAPYDPRYQAYQESIRQQIQKRLGQYVNHPDYQTGEVFVSFDVRSNGSLENMSVVDGRTFANQYLREISLKSIHDATPFPPFPRGLDYSRLTFQLGLSFEK